MQIKRLVLAHTGTYNNMYLRPYKANVDVQNVEALVKATQHGRKFDPRQIAGVAGRIIAPSEHVRGPAQIPGGWGVPRMRFLIEVADDTGFRGEMVQYLMGYTDSVGLSSEGAIDPNMRLYFNRSVMLRHPKPQDGSTVELIGAHHVLTGNVNISNAAQIGANCALRPQDIFSAMGVSSLVMSDVDIVDMRQTFVAEPFKLSDMMHSVPTQYLSRIGEEYFQALRDADTDDSAQEIFATAAMGVRDLNLNQYLFMAEAFLRTDLRRNGYLTYGELVRIQPGLEALTSVFATNGANHERGATSEWDNTEPETLLASVLIHALPAVMADNLLSGMLLQAHMGEVDGEWQVGISAVTSFAALVASKESLTSFKSDLVDKVLRDINPDKKHMFISATVDLFGETQLSIAIGTGPVRSYCAPSFADALYAPVLADAQYALSMLSHGLIGLFDNLNAVAKDR